MGSRSFLSVPRAFDDSGQLIVRDAALEYSGEKYEVTILRTQLRHISFGRRGDDRVNRWIDIEYGVAEPFSQALFASGSGLGWGGFLGGTNRIMKAIEETFVSNTDNRRSATWAANHGEMIADPPVYSRVSGGEQNDTESAPVTHTPNTSLELFFSYSHKDEALRRRLADHLRALERQEVIAGWHDHKISAGTEWQ